MKFFLTPIFLVCFFIAFGQENEFCRLNDNKLNELYESLDDTRNKNDKAPIVFYVTANNTSELETISDWANKKGYSVNYAWDTNVDTAIAINKTVDAFSFTVYNIVYKDIEQALNRMGIGCFALKIDTCDGRKMEHIVKFYNQYIINSRINSETLYFYQFISFDFGKEKKIPELTEWAKANGYEIKVGTLEYTSSTSGELKKFTNLTIEKKLGVWDIDYFTKEINKTTEAMIKLKIPQCLNTGMGVSGNSKM